MYELKICPQRENEMSKRSRRKTKVKVQLHGKMSQQHSTKSTQDTKYTRSRSQIATARWEQIM